MADRMPPGRIEPRRDLTYGTEWQEVNDTLRRLMVPGGWLVVNHYGDAFGFVPDENHAWKLEKQREEEESEEVEIHEGEDQSDESEDED